MLNKPPFFIPFWTIRKKLSGKPLKPQNGIHLILLKREGYPPLISLENLKENHKKLIFHPKCTMELFQDFIFFVIYHNQDQSENARYGVCLVPQNNQLLHLYFSIYHTYFPVSIYIDNQIFFENQQTGEHLWQVSIENKTLSLMLEIKIKEQKWKIPIFLEWIL